MKEQLNERDNDAIFLNGLQLETERTFIRSTEQQGKFAVDKTSLNEVENETMVNGIYSKNATVLYAFLKDGGNYIGYLELKGLNTKPELGIELRDEYRHKGYGYEICKETILYIFTISDVSCISYKCLRKNVASQRLAEKLGAIKTGEIDVYQVLHEKFAEKGITKERPAIYAEYDIIVYEIPRRNAT